MSAAPSERRAYTVRQFSEAFSLSRATVYNLIRRGEIEARKVGGRTLIPAAIADSWFASLPEVR